TIYASDSSCDAIGYGMDYMIGIHITVIISVLLLIRLAFPRKFGNVPKKFTENIIYEKLLSDKLSADLGYVYENVVAQMLKAKGHELYYYTWPSETSNHLYEVDFLLSHGTKIQPIEVKSSGYKAHKSLDLFCEKFSSRVNKRYIIYTKDFRKEGELTYLPVYMTSFL
ncbi:MAG: DUF4143 domain-containing protein, partial [Porphyromonadaceae bacterium]|nr:DUF4143 domain-containing protein [Porphyromonadaceae bacterium]